MNTPNPTPSPDKPAAQAETPIFNKIASAIDDLATNGRFYTNYRDRIANALADGFSMERALTQLRAENERLKAQLEHEHNFDAANDAFSSEQPPWRKAKEPTPEEAFAYFKRKALEPSDAAIRLAKFIPLDHQGQLIDNPVMWALVKWLDGKESQLTHLKAELERANGLLARVPLDALKHVNCTVTASDISAHLNPKKTP